MDRKSTELKSMEARELQSLTVENLEKVWKLGLMTTVRSVSLLGVGVEEGSVERESERGERSWCDPDF